MQARIALLALMAAGWPIASAFGQPLPDGGVVAADGRGAVQAWYERPTERYGHGVLGDAIEAGSLVVLDHEGIRHEHVLPHRQVFEDITPRLADLDGDGRNEVVTIRSDLDTGAAVAVYAVNSGALVEIAASDPIGQRNRWLSIAAIADFLGDGTRTAAVVRTPHLSGVLELLALRNGRLVRVAGPEAGYSSHAIGSRVLMLALVVDRDGDGIVELAVPDLARRQVAFVTFTDGLRVLSRHALPTRISDQIRVTASGAIAVPLEDGTLFEIRN